MKDYTCRCYHRFVNRRHIRCGRPLSEHVGPDRVCPVSHDGKRRFFKLYTVSKARRSTSYTPAEAALLDAVLTAMPRWRDAAVLVRHPRFAALARKVRSLRVRGEVRLADGGREAAE